MQIICKFPSEDIFIEDKEIKNSQLKYSPFKKLRLWQSKMILKSEFTT